MTTSPLAPAYRLVTVAVVVVTTMIAFENMAVTTAMPLAAAELGSVESYGLAFSAMMTGMLLGIVLAGPWADRAGPVPPMYAGLALFLAGTLGCALAPSIGLLLLGRTVTGLGAGLVVIAEFVAVGRVFPSEVRPRVFTWLSGAWVLPSLVGAPVAGWIAATLSWRWVFGAVVLPAVIAGALLGSRRDQLGRAAAPDDARAPDTAPADADAAAVDPVAAERTEHLRVARLGAVVALSAGVIQLVIHAQPGLASALGVAGVLAVVGLVWSAPRLLPRGTFAATRGLPSVMLSRALFNGAFMALVTFVPLLLSRERGIDLPTVGLVLAFASLGWSAGSWWQGRSQLSGPVARSRLVVLGAIVLTAGIAGCTVLIPWPGVPLPLLTAVLALTGLGMGLGSTTLSVLVLDLAPAAEHGRASAALQLSDVLGTVVGIATATGVFALLHREGDQTAYTVIWGGLTVVAALAILSGSRCAPSSTREHVPG